MVGWLLFIESESIDSAFIHQIILEFGVDCCIFLKKNTFKNIFLQYYHYFCAFSVTTLKPFV